MAPDFIILLQLEKKEFSLMINMSFMWPLQYSNHKPYVAAEFLKCG
jgi:hypothetical protein